LIPFAFNYTKNMLKFLIFASALMFAVSGYAGLAIGTALLLFLPD